MPFPWKRLKSAKISRLVNDHLHISQKRRDGSSLVVETGFPTSLVDLFIKNREKLKKSSREKRHSPPLTPITGANDPVVAESLAPISSPLISSCLTILQPPIAGSSDPLINCPLDVQPSPPNSSLSPLSSRDSAESPVVGSSDGDACAGAKRGLFLFLKTFVVVFLALGMKRLTVGITISAFFLLFLEFLVKRMRGLLRPPSDSKGAFRWMIPRICSLLRIKEVSTPELQQDHTLKLESVESRCLNQELQITEVKDYLLTWVEKIQSENEITAESSIQEIESKESVIEKEDPECEVLESKKIKTRRAKIKLKMKKLFWKKSSSRKEQEPQRLNIVKAVLLCDEQVVECRDDGELECVPKLSSISSAKSKNRVVDPFSAVSGLPEVNEETANKNQEKGNGTETGSTRIYLVLCLIVLVGLIGGRSFALLLTLSWYLLLKLGEKMPRYMKTSWFILY